MAISPSSESSMRIIRSVVSMSSTHRLPGGESLPPSERFRSESPSRGKGVRMLPSEKIFRSTGRNRNMREERTR